MDEILILHATCGGGHKAAARALERAFAEADPLVPTRVIDALDAMTPASRRLYTGSFEVAVAHAPALYGAFFAMTRNADRSPVFRAARGVANGVQCPGLASLLRAARPRAIVCTHFLPLEVALREKRAGRLEAPIYAVVTDYVAHGLWRQPEADLTFCPPGRAAVDLVLGGVSPERIARTGIPIDPGYAESGDALRDVKRRSGLPLDRPTILLLAGGAGMGPLVAVLRETAREVGPGAEIVVVCGKNEALRVECARAASELASPVRVLGFVDPIQDLLRAADVVVTKPGGLTTSECLALGKAIVFYESAPGQESANARYAIDRDAGLDGGSPRGAARAAALLARREDLRARLGQRARRVARPDAAQDIARLVLARSEVALEIHALVA
jgi:processive 1,2-diacylglycerol beta-glucosyltransferase